MATHPDDKDRVQGTVAARHLGRQTTPCRGRAAVADLLGAGHRGGVGAALAVEVHHGGVGAARGAGQAWCVAGEGGQQFGDGGGHPSIVDRPIPWTEAPWVV